MGTIFSGTGLVSGIDIQSLVNQLVAVSARPRDLLEQRIGTIDAQRTALLDLSARISAILSRATELKRASAFGAVKASSANTSVLTATAASGAVPGTYSFVVQSLATRHQVVSRGFASADASLSSGVVTIESAAARVNARTRLEELNGFAGVQRGALRLTDASGASATISLTDAVTLADVVERINTAGLSIRAEVRGDHLRLVETSGGALRVSEVDGGRVAADLGFGPGNTYSATGRLDGSDLVYLSGTTPLSQLNDGLGVRRAAAGGDFSVSGDGFSTFTVDLSGLLTHETRLAQLNHGTGVNLGRVRITTTDAAGVATPYELDLSGLETVGQVVEAISQGVPGVTVTLAGSPSRLVVGYADGSTTRALKIEDVSGTAARDLGIAGDVQTGKINGRQILFMDSVQDVLNAVQYASGNDGSVRATIEGARLVLYSDAGGKLTLTDVGQSQALADLGLTAGTYEGQAAGARLLGGIDSVLLRTLNGGAGISGGVVRIQAGTSDVTVDLAGVQTLAEAVERIRDSLAAGGMDVEIGYDTTGTRLELRSVDGVTSVTVRDVQGGFAQQTGLAGTGAVLRGVNLQRRYVSETTALSELNGGAGVTPGSLRITNSLGVFKTIDLSAGTVRTLGDVIAEINRYADELRVRARINDTGDGLLLEDAAGGTLALKVEDVSGSTARDLKLAGEFEDGRVDGSFEERYDVSRSGQTLGGLLAAISAQSRLATASLLNDGTAYQPYRLQVSSRATGTSGELLLDGGTTGLDFTTLVRAQDARVLLSGGVMVTSASNTITELVPGLTLTLTGTSDSPVEVTVARDVDKLVESLKGLVSSFNAALDRISQLGRYDPETQTRGVLLGDGSLLTIESRLRRFATQRAEGQLSQLSQVGLRLEGGRLVLDEQKLRDRMAEDPTAVSELFTDPQDGLAVWLESQTKAITGASGLIGRRTDALEQQRDSLKARVDQMNELLGLKRERLTRQFLAMEQALAQLQSQQSALSQLAIPGTTA